MISHFKGSINIPSKLVRHGGWMWFKETVYMKRIEKKKISTKWRGGGLRLAD